MFRSSGRASTSRCRAAWRYQSRHALESEAASDAWASADRRVRPPPQQELEAVARVLAAAAGVAGRDVVDGERVDVRAAVEQHAERPDRVRGARDVDGLRLAVELARVDGRAAVQERTDAADVVAPAGVVERQRELRPPVSSAVSTSWSAKTRDGSTSKTAGAMP